MKPRAIMTCVEYDDLLAITLPHTIPLVDDLLIVTSDSDERTKAVCRRHGVRFHSTGAFHAKGASFNKGAALEEGFDILGRHGWILILDADIVLPQDLAMPPKRGYLWGARRVVWNDPWSWNGQPWQDMDTEPDGDILGYFQLFLASDAPKRPWYPMNYKSAATVDQWFQWKHWPNRGRYLHHKVLHLGSTGENWCGRVKPRQDGRIPGEADHRRAVLNDMIQRRLRGEQDAELLS